MKKNNLAVLALQAKVKAAKSKDKDVKKEVKPGFDFVWTEPVIISTLKERSGDLLEMLEGASAFADNSFDEDTNQEIEKLAWDVYQADKETWWAVYHHLSNMFYRKKKAGRATDLTPTQGNLKVVDGKKLRYPLSYYLHLREVIRTGKFNWHRKMERTKRDIETHGQTEEGLGRSLNRLAGNGISKFYKGFRRSISRMADGLEANNQE